MKNIIVLLFVVYSNFINAQCTHPTGITSNAKGNNVSIKWKDKSCASGYKIKYREVTSKIWKYKILPDTLETTIYGLKYSTDYEYAVSSIDTSPTNYSFIKYFSTKCECIIPIVVVDSIGSNAVKFLWQEDSCDINYQIQYRKLGKQLWNSLVFRDSLISAISPTLLSNTDYEYRFRRICSIDGLYTSQWSAIYQFTTNPLTNKKKYFKEIIK